jgi:hypothetical protein
MVGDPNTQGTVPMIVDIQLDPSPDPDRQRHRYLPLDVEVGEFEHSLAVMPENAGADRTEQGPCR